MKITPPHRVALRTGPALFCGAAILLTSVGPLGCASTVSGLVEGPEYPARKKQTRSLDVQALREDTILTMTNTTAQSFPPCTMWVNQWFSRPFPGLAVGQTIEIPLAEFKDKYGETFRAGGFFAVNRPTRVVLAQLELENEMLGLVVVGEQ